MKKLPLHKIGFDFDGVIADTAETFVRLACEKYGYCSFSREDITNFDLEDCINVPLDLVEKIFTEIMLDSVGNNLQPIPGAVDTLQSFTEISTITIITARPTHKPVHDWLDHFFPLPVRERIKVITTGDHNDKLRHIHACGLEYFIDDRAETCMQLAQENISPYVYTQPWNINRHNLPTLDNWQSIRELVLEEQEPRP